VSTAVPSPASAGAQSDRDGRATLRTDGGRRSALPGFNDFTLAPRREVLPPSYNDEFT